MEGATSAKVEDEIQAIQLLAVFVKLFRQGNYQGAADARARFMQTGRKLFGAGCNDDGVPAADGHSCYIMPEHVVQSRLVERACELAVQHLREREPK